MTITLNGKPHAVDAGTVLLDLVAGVTGRRLGPGGQPEDGQRLGVAVALNSEVVPRASWAATAIKAGDDVELVTAVQGG